MKFSEFAYKRPEIEKIIKEYRISLNNLKECKNPEHFLKIVKKIIKIKEDFESVATLVNIRFKINTQDEFYKKERAAIDEMKPSIDNINKDFFEIIVNSRFKRDFENKYGKSLVEKMQLYLKTISPKIIKILEEENKLISEYSKLIGSAELIFKDKKMNLSEISTYFSSNNRGIRKEANEIYWRFFSDNEDKFDEIYDRLIKKRHEMAKALGYDNFIELAYDKWGRNDYDKEDVKQLRENIIKDYIRLTEKIIEWQKRNLGIKKLKYYDEANVINEEIKPKGNAETKIDNTRNMFHEMSEETTEFFDFMADNELLDLIPRKGKAVNGFCDFIANEKSPFIFMNFNDTERDITTLNHECGHALSDYINKEKEFRDWNFVGLEIAEIHSMSMEFFSWPWMKNFFNEEDKFKLVHLTKAILFVPYGALVDEFQHWVYKNPQATAKERKTMWREIEKKYLPHRDYEENAFLENGGYWFRQLHLFEVPFYYIDYVIAQFCAFQYLIKSQKDFKKAWKEYIDLIECVVSKGYLDTIKTGKLKNPFKEKNIKGITSDIEKLFENLKKA